MKKFNVKSAWVQRKLIYGALAVALGVAVAFGIITQEQADGVTANLDSIIGVLASLSLALASAKTHEGSDDKTTKGDLDAALKKIDRLSEAVQNVVNNAARGDEPKPETPGAPFGSIYPQG
ncbi:hypothetical protein CIP107538_01321 [Corynebacterium diphtheriae]|nr:hypothetical protein CIP107538_01321 [Corynebacterium diphtheriae]CAB0929003.1 hypothetical protein FRC0435_01233 [Corynebacterium diphtheriae]CAB0929189.1 hypothetical protein FRC0434_01235 [Corynebacterium diphtheriae]